MSKKNIIVNFIIQKLKSKHNSLKKLSHVTQDLPLDPQVVSLILLCVWAERANLGSAKTALKFRYELGDHI